MAPKRGKAAAEEPPKAKARGKAKAEPEPAPKARGGAKAKAAPKEEPAPPPPKARGGAKAKAVPEEPPAKKAKAEAQGTKRKAEEPKATSQAASSSSSNVNAAVEVPEKLYFEDGDFTVEYAKSSRSECRKCKEKIMQGVLRIGKSMPSDKFDGMYTVWQHWTCFLATGLLPKSTQLIKGFSNLKPEDQDAISQYVPANAAGDGGGAEIDPELAQKLKDQSKQLFDIQDCLSQMSDAQLREVLELNDYPTKKFNVSATIKELIADGILFGATEKCEVCETGAILLDGDGYKCRGWVNEFLKCTFKTQTPKRTQWQLTQACKQCGNGKIGKMKLKTGDRVFAAEMRDDEQIAASQDASKKQDKPALLGMTFSVLQRGDEKNKTELEDLIKANAGSVTEQPDKTNLCVISHSEIVVEGEDEEDEHPTVTAAKQLGVPGAKETFLTESVTAGEVVDMTPYILWGRAPKHKSQMSETKTKFIEKFGVNMDSAVGEEIAKTAHVLVDKTKKVVYSEMLTKTDMVSGSNSFYVLHVLEADDSSKYWVFRKWGRIGVNQGGTKLEELSKFAAINEFKKKFLDQTGNSFDNIADFQVKPGKMVRVEVEHKCFSKKKAGDEAAGDGDAAAAEGGDQPLGKLSKAQIEKGDGVLDKIQKILDEGLGDDAATKAKNNALILGFSSEYYTMVPHNFGAKKPPPINNAELLGAEKALLAFYLRMGFEDIGGEEEDKLTPISGVMELPCPKSLHDSAHMVCGKKDITSCVTKGTTMHKKGAGKPPKPMTPDLYGAILLYTSNAIYKQLNKALREEDRKVVETFFPYLRFLFEAASRMATREVTLWRGVGVDLFPTYKVGSTIIWWGVSSCTSDEKVARNFMAGCGDGATLLTVETKTACDISEVSFFTNEAESILLPGTQLEVLSSKKVGKKSEIRLREVGRVVT